MAKYETRENVTLLNENEKIFAVFHKPLLKLQEKCPAIIICHGFAGQKTGRYRLYVTLAEELVRKGIAVLRFDFRGCGDSEGDFFKTTLFGEVSDALKALEFLKVDKDIDPERLGVFGRSLGGVVALLAARQFKKIKSIVLWAPLFTAESWREKWEQLKKENKPMMMDGELVGATFLHQLFELELNTVLEDLREVPFLHIHAEKDSVVTSEHKQQYEAARDEAKNRSSFISLPNSDHAFSDITERMQAVKETVSWFIDTL